jgi:lipid-binding SYLF domain-containing protein
VPIPGTDCVSLHAIRTITMADGSGSLTLTQVGTKCPRSGSASAEGDPYTVAKTYTVSGATGIFAGATGSGSDINRSAGNEQVSVLQGTLSVP